MNVYIPGIKLVTPNVTYRNASMFARKKTAMEAARQKSNITLVLNTIRKPKLPIVVRIVRLGPMLLDTGDNLNTSAKYVRDAIADWIGIDDRDRRIEWQYAQYRNNHYGVEIHIEEKLYLSTEVEVLKKRLKNAVNAAKMWKMRAKKNRDRGVEFT